MWFSYDISDTTIKSSYKKTQNYSPLEIHSPIQINNQKLNICYFYSKYHFLQYFLKIMTFYFIFSGIGGGCDFLPKYTIKSYLLYQLKVPYELFFIKRFKFHNFVTRVIKMINFITSIQRTWPLSTNTNVPKHTQNSYGMCYLQYQVDPAPNQFGPKSFWPKSIRPHVDSALL